MYDKVQGPVKTLLSHQEIVSAAQERLFHLSVALSPCTASGNNYQKRPSSVDPKTDFKAYTC